MCRFVRVAGEELPASAQLADVAIHLSTAWEPIPAQFNVLLTSGPPTPEDEAKRDLYDLSVAPSEAAAEHSIESAFEEAGRSLRIEPVGLELRPERPEGVGTEQGQP
jgi:hypothetical protein